MAYSISSYSYKRFFYKRSARFLRRSLRSFTSFAAHGVATLVTRFPFYRFPRRLRAYTCSARHDVSLDPLRRLQSFEIRSGSVRCLRFPSPSLLRQLALLLHVFSACIVFSLLLGLPASSQQPWYNPNETARDSSKAFTLYQRAFKAFQMGDYNSTINLCRQAKNYDHANKNIVHLEALALAESGDNYNAMLQFRCALSLDYNFIQCRNNYALFLRKNGKTEEARLTFLQCVQVDPKYPDAHYHLGEILKERGDLDGAIEYFETAARLNPKYYEAQRDLGLAIFEKATTGHGGNISDSMEKLQIAARLNPNNPMIHYYLGTIYCAQGHLDKAEAEFRLSLMCDPKLASSHFELGKLRYYRGDPDRCIYELKQALTINPLYGEDHKYPKLDEIMLKRKLAESYEIKGKLIDSVETFKEVAAMEKKNEETLKHIAEIEKQLRSRKKKKPLPYDPEEVQALIAKGLSEIEDGQFDGAKKSLSRALELDPNSFEANQYIGSLLEATGDLNGAMSRYQTAIALRPKFDGAYYNFAYLLEKMNLSSDAGNMYQKFHEIAGRYPYDPRHVVTLQQEEARQRARAEQMRKRGY